jgi:hypothetical protein
MQGAASRMQQLSLPRRREEIFSLSLFFFAFSYRFCATNKSTISIGLYTGDPDFKNVPCLCSAMPMTMDEIAALAVAIKALDNDGPGRVASTSVKLPPFWASDPEVWFLQVEAQFQTRNPAITVDLTKYNYVVGALDNTTASEVRAIIRNPPANNKYDGIKAALIAAYGRTQAQKDLELLTMGDLGDRRPTALLRYIRGLSTDPNTIYKALFLSKLPVDVRKVLAASPTTDLEELAKEADRIMDAGTQASHFVSAVSSSKSSSSKSSSPNDQSLCYFHSRFGEKARNCNRDKCRMAHLVSKSSASAISSQAGNDQASH